MFHFNNEGNDGYSKGTILDSNNYTPEMSSFVKRINGLIKRGVYIYCEKVSSKKNGLKKWVYLNLN